MTLINPDAEPSWREMWAAEMRTRKWLWRANAGLVAWFIIDQLGRLL